MNSSTTVTKIAGALLKAQKEMGDVSKTARNPFYKSTYADLNSIREVVTPALNVQGIAVLQPTITLGDKNFVETILLHESGEFISGITEIKNGDGKPQSEGSGISYARRYGLQSMLNVGAVDDDGEAAQGRRAETSTSKVSLRSETGAVAKADEVKPNDGISSTAGGTNKTTGNGSAAVNVDSGAKSERPVKELITEAFKNLEAQKKITLIKFKSDYLNGKGLGTSTQAELTTAWAKVQKDFYTNGNGVAK